MSSYILQNAIVVSTGHVDFQTFQIVLQLERNQPYNSFWVLHPNFRTKKHVSQRVVIFYKTQLLHQQVM